MTGSKKLLQALRDTTNPAYHAVADAYEALAAECGGYLAAWAVRYAEISGLPAGEIHPQHYDRMAELGCRMVGFRRADPTAAP